MSYIALAEAKAFLDVIHTSDDDKLQLLLNGAEQQALDFMNRNSFAEICEQDSNFDSDTAQMPDNVRVGIFFLLQAMYQADEKQIELLNKAAETLIMPYRCEMGI